MDMVFYDVNYDQLNTHIVYNETDFYNPTLEGIPAYLKLQIPNSENYTYYPDFNLGDLKAYKNYAVLTYRYKQFYSTKNVLGIMRMTLDDITIIKKS